MLCADSARQGKGRKADRPPAGAAERSGGNSTEDEPAEAGSQTKASGGHHKPGSVSSGGIPCRTGLRWQPFICSPDCSGALAANPGLSARNTPTLLAKGARPLFGLAPGGVCHAVAVASPPVRSYRTLSPLPVRPFRGSHRRFALCGTFPCAPEGAPAGVTRHPCFVEPGLSSHLATRGCLRPPDKAAYRPADGGRKPPACYRVRP